MEEDGIFKYPKNVVPMGHNAVYNTVPGGTNIPSASFNTDTNRCKWNIW